ncbi:hypothetical protein [Vibrio sp. 99-70-13A1]|uniref:hypothetical protein n=1 Tax=Vibrio sp. 99-70-13A1 TaxID=2607601 RepID=UPI0014938868|nr:hypothetical protein [Vibrio sp. 99-70-13A1]NOH99173.1 hypothetical protein [Vibrio sp. 99-70-13A1]
MNNEIPAIASTKNDWLLSQVDVAFPTKECLLGRDIYQQNIQKKSYQVITSTDIDNNENQVDEIYKVDFHKLTVMFSLNQASAGGSETQKANLLEFFSQIILCDDHSLYIGLANGDVVASAILTVDEESLLVSDVVNNHSNQNALDFAYQLIAFWKQDHGSKAKCWLES